MVILKRGAIRSASFPPPYEMEGYLRISHDKQGIRPGRYDGCSSWAESGNESRGKMAQWKNIEPSRLPFCVPAEGVNLIKGRPGCLI